MLLAIEADQYLTLEGADIGIAYLYGDLDIPILIEQQQIRLSPMLFQDMYAISTNPCMARSRQTKYGAHSLTNPS